MKGITKQLLSPLNQPQKHYEQETRKSGRPQGAIKSMFFHAGWRQFLCPRRKRDNLSLKGKGVLQSNP